MKAMKKIFLLIVLAVAGAVSAAAQKAEVESFEPAPMDVTAQQYARLDLHGEKCALVKVSVVAPNVTFQGNVMGDVQKRGSEYWVYLTSGTKMVRISADSFLAFMYDFPEPLQGGVTYMLTIEAPQPGGGQAGRPVENYLVLKVQPANANVFVKVDGMPKNVEDGTVTVSLADGPHTYSVDAVGFARQEGTVTMDGKRESRTITLVSTKPTLTVSATTPGTEIFINDTRKGTDSWSGELMADTYVVEGRLNGHRTHSQKVTLAEGQNQRLTIPALTPITGSLNVNYKPVDATITIDGREAGVTPNVIRDLLVGTHRVEISAPGYTTATLTANVTESTPATLTGSLTAKPSDPYADDIALTNEYVWFKDSSTGKRGFKHNGTIVIPARYDRAGNFSEGLASVEINGKWGFIDKSGNMVIPARYYDAWSFSEGLALVEINYKRGFIDKSGTLVIPARYDNTWSFSEGLVGVKINGKWGFIDKSGTLVIPARYDYVFDNNGVYGFKNGKAKVELNGRSFYIDRKGNEVK